MNKRKRIEGTDMTISLVGDNIELIDDDLGAIDAPRKVWIAICRAILDGTKYEVVKKETVHRPSLIARVEALEVEQLKGKEHGEKS